MKKYYKLCPFVIIVLIGFLSNITIFSESDCKTLIKKDIEYYDSLTEKNLMYNIETINSSGDMYEISGWAISKGVESIDTEIILIIENDEKVKMYISEKNKRPDVTSYINDGVNYTDSGFVFKIISNQKVSKDNIKIRILSLKTVN